MEPDPRLLPWFSPLFFDEGMFISLFAYYEIFPLASLFNTMRIDVFGSLSPLSKAEDMGAS